MKILIIMRGYFPGQKYGGPPVSVDNFCSLMKEHSCYVVTHNHDLLSKQPYPNIHRGWNDRGNCKVLYLCDKQYNKVAFEKIITKLSPDVLYLQSVFESCVLPILQIAKKHNIRVLLAPRGELCKGAFNMKKYKKLPYIKLLRIMGLIKNVHFQSTSDEETEAINKLLDIPMSRIHRLDNIPSIPKRDYQRLEKSAGKGRFIFLSRIHPKKNLLGAIKYFSHVDSEVVFDIYGSIEDKSYWKECQEAIKALPKNIKCEYKGLVPHDRVHEVFSQYDAFVFPTLSENYGHVIAEALASGCHLIVSKGTTPWDDVNENGGFALSLKDEKAWPEAIDNISNMSDEEYTEFNQKLNEYIKNKLMNSSLIKSYLEFFSLGSIALSTH